MERKLKFRAYSKQRDQFLTKCYPIGWEDNCGFELCGITEGEGDDETKEDGLVLMQYTGLNDKNGKEIYEGDILGFEEFDYENNTEKFFYYEIKFGKTPDDRYGYFLKGLTLSNYKVFNADFRKGEVIGNIYENKELL